MERLSPGSRARWRAIGHSTGVHPVCLVNGRRIRRAELHDGYCRHPRPGVAATAFSSGPQADGEVGTRRQLLDIPARPNPDSAASHWKGLVPGWCALPHTRYSFTRRSNGKSKTTMSNAPSVRITIRIMLGLRLCTGCKTTGAHGVAMVLRVASTGRSKSEPGPRLGRAFGCVVIPRNPACLFPISRGRYGVPDS